MSPSPICAKIAASSVRIASSRVDPYAVDGVRASRASRVSSGSVNGSVARSIATAAFHCATTAGMRTLSTLRRAASGSARAAADQFMTAPIPAVTAMAEPRSLRKWRASPWPSATATARRVDPSGRTTVAWLTASWLGVPAFR